MKKPTQIPAYDFDVERPSGLRLFLEYWIGLPLPKVRPVTPFHKQHTRDEKCVQSPPRISIA